MTIPTTRTSGRHPMLTAEQREASRLRWETNPAPGYAWLAREIEEAFGVRMSRTACQSWAWRYGWTKRVGEFSEPLAPTLAIEQEGAPNSATEPQEWREPKQSSGSGCEGRTLAVLARELTAYFEKPAVGPDCRPVLPTLERFALLQGATAHELRAWGTLSAVFGRALVLASERQRALLIEGAAAGIFSADLAAKVLQAQGRVHA